MQEQSSGRQASIQVSLAGSKEYQDEYVPYIREDLLTLDEEALRAKGIKLRGKPFENILGIGLAGENGQTVTDKELKEDYTNYLTEKYS